MCICEQGKLFVRGDSKIFRFQNGKTESLFLQRKNPRRIAWTTLCRRQRRKGLSEVNLSTAPFHSIPVMCSRLYRSKPKPAVADKSSPSALSLVLPSM